VANANVRTEKKKLYVFGAIKSLKHGTRLESIAHNPAEIKLT